MEYEFSNLELLRIQAKGSNLHEIRSVADQRAFVEAEVAEVEKAFPVGGSTAGSEPGTIVEPNQIAKR